MMKNSDRKLPEVQLYLRKLQNPYASLEVFDEAPLETYRARGNPYAKLSESRFEMNFDKLETSPRPRELANLPSQADFEKRCRHIFSQQIPHSERGKLRPHHRAFIARNKVRSPRYRQAILNELAKYDLSADGLSPHFNREDETFTEAKLRQIERYCDVHE